MSDRHSAPRCTPQGQDRHRAPWGTEVLAGCSGALVMVAVVLTLGVLGFSPLGAGTASLGLQASFVSVAIGGLVFAGLARQAMPVAGPSSATALICAGLMAQLSNDPALTSSPAGIAMAMATMSLAVVVMGLLLVGMAFLRLGRLAQFVPQPVLAGFMNGVAVLIVLAQAPTLMGLAEGTPLGGHGVELSMVQPAALALGLGTALCAALVAWRWPNAPAQLIGLGAGVAAYFGLHAAWPELALGARIGPLPQTLPWPDLSQRLLVDGSAAFVWRHGWAVLSAGVVMALVAALESVLNALAIDQVLDEQHDADRMLLSLGTANLLSALMGGLPVVLMRARAMATLRSGGKGRRAALAGALAYMLMYLLLGPLLACLPKVVLAGIMITVAFALADRWTHQLLSQWRQGERSTEAWQSLAVVAIVAVLTVWKGFAVGVISGIVVAVVLFVSHLNRSLIRSSHTAVAEPSRRAYSIQQESYLKEARARVAVFELEGSLFFGTAERLSSQADALDGRTRCLVLDLRGVGMIDASGAMLLQQLSSRLARRGIALLLAGVTPEHPHGRCLRAFGCFRESPRDDWHPDLDRAVEAAERLLLREADLATDDAKVELAETTLFHGLDARQAELLRGHLQRIRLAPGQILFREGDAGDGLFLLTRGAVSIVAGTGAAYLQQRYASFSAGLMLGEMAMLDGRGRSAAATADTESELYHLTPQALEAIATQDPDLAARLYRNMALHLADRLRRATSLRSTVPLAGAAVSR